VATAPVDCHSIFTQILNGSDKPVYWLLFALRSRRFWQRLFGLVN